MFVGAPLSATAEDSLLAVESHRLAAIISDTLSESPICLQVIARRPKCPLNRGRGATPFSLPLPPVSPYLLLPMATGTGVLMLSPLPR